MTKIEKAKEKEIVIRGNTVYFRKAFPRNIEKANYNRLRTLLYFGEGAWQAYGKSYEEVIKNVQENMKKIPIPESNVENVFLLDKLDIATLRFKLLGKGYKKGDTVKFPNNTCVINLDGNRQMKKIVL